MTEAEKRMREIYAQELDRDGEGMAAFLWRESEPAHPDSSNGRIIRAMLAAEAAAIERVAGQFEALATMMEGRRLTAPDAGDGRAYAESARMHRANAAVIRSLKEGASHVG